MAQVDIEGQRSKEEQPSVGYPDICFAIEDFDDAFRGLVSYLHIIRLSKARKKPMLQINKFNQFLSITAQCGSTSVVYPSLAA